MSDSTNYESPDEFLQSTPPDTSSMSITFGNDNAMDEKIIDDYFTIHAIITAYQTDGHKWAKIDPLGISGPSTEDKDNILSSIFGDDVSRKCKSINTNRKFMLPPLLTFIGGEEKKLPLNKIIKRLENVYCKNIGIEFKSLSSSHDEAGCWLRQRLETPGAGRLDDCEKRLLLGRLVQAAGFESFLRNKYPGEKRFGLEGCEILIPAMKQIIDRATEFGVESFIIGMAHRGRLNVLANVIKKPLEQIFTQFQPLESHEEGSGDLKYHLGAYIERFNRTTSKNIRLSLVANPSHLECESPVVEGKTRAEQFFRGDCEGNKIMAIIIHGDAAFCGQGVVYETIHLSQLPDYTTHGTMHLIINNQIGFTTDPRHARSSPYCTDVAKVVEAPIFHVNSDCPEDVIHVSNIATEWRNKFHRDVVLDIVCYRRYGHNEVDEPMLTQPLMYTLIQKTKPVNVKYSEKLINEGLVTAEEVKSMQNSYADICLNAYNTAQGIKEMVYQDWVDLPWTGFFEGKDPYKMNKTGVKEETLQHIGVKFSSLPPPSAEFVIHPGLERILKTRMKLVKKRQVDWTLAEAIAIGSLLKEHVHVRLSGQDVERGTFCNRHHVLHHQTLDKATYRPLSYLYPDQEPYIVCNSSLSEYAILGFELGYSMTSPYTLVLWEAQFGDFNNTAQCIIDQFLSSGEAKWIRQSGLVLLQPHGMEGMGPEHSSAHLERFLQMSTDDPDAIPPEGPEFIIHQLHNINWIVANCSTPANYFHILRRQIAMPFRKPLILMTPKSILRYPPTGVPPIAISCFDDMTEDTEFHRLIPETGVALNNPADVRKLLFCSGQVFYDLNKLRTCRQLEAEIAISRIEQLSPFPYDLVKEECHKYPNAKLVWVQEEHKNQGAWLYMQPRFKVVLGHCRKICYIGRGISAAPSTSCKMQHLKELQTMLDEAMAQV